MLSSIIQTQAGRIFLIKTILQSYYHQEDYGAACPIAEIAKQFLARPVKGDNNIEELKQGKTEEEKGVGISLILAFK